MDEPEPVLPPAYVLPPPELLPDEPAAPAVPPAPVAPLEPVVPVEPVELLDPLDPDEPLEPLEPELSDIAARPEASCELLELSRITSRTWPIFLPPLSYTSFPIRAFAVNC